MLAYLTQVILFQLVFLLAYEILLKKETFFSYNRWYLLLSPIIALILPLLKLNFLSEAVPVESFQALPKNWLPEVVIGNAEARPLVQQTSNTGNPLNWWLIAYSAGVGISLINLIIKFRRLLKLSAQAKVERGQKLTFYSIPNSSIACTFFNQIFIGDLISEKDREQIMAHELVHIEEKHSFDLVFFELFKILFWFNPLIYIYQSKLAALHEFIADEKAVKLAGKQNYYEQLLNTAFGTQNISFINQFFNHSLIKKRILMLQKNKSKTISKFKYLLFIPLLLVMLTYVACSDEILEKEPTEEISTVEHEILLDKYWQELKDMKEQGASFQKISSVFMPNSRKGKLSKEEHYKFLALFKEITESSKERKIANNNYTEKDKEYYVKANEMLSRTYEQYIESQKNNPIVESEIIEVQETQELKKVPFAIIEEVPIFPGCEDLASNEARKKCMSDKITQFVAKNFDTGIGKNMGLEGTKRVIVQFRIDENGNIQDVRSRAPAPELEDEAKRVINSLPQMQPGMHQGKATSVMYSLPIAFKVNG